MSDTGRPLTEAEYLAWASAKTQEIADDLNQRLAGVLPPGMRFEWTSTEEQR